jgi:HEPN domain-containing protein
MDINAVESFWVTEAEEALRVADHLMGAGDYSYALFFGHLAIEKYLKAKYVYNHKGHAPPIHNLLRFAKLTGIKMPEDKVNELIEISGSKEVFSEKMYCGICGKTDDIN